MRKQLTLKDVQKYQDLLAKQFNEVGRSLVLSNQETWTLFLEKMTLCGDIIDNYSEIIDIQKLEFSSDINAMCVFTMRENMEYKGINNDDLAIYTSILKKLNSKWKISFMHRSSGEVDLSLWTGHTTYNCSSERFL